MRNKIDYTKVDPNYYDIVPLAKIDIPSRIRKDLGNIRALAGDIQKHGLINPITVLYNATIGEGYPLIAGQRRYEAVKLLGWKEVRCYIISTEDAMEILELEIAENEMRKEFTISEKLDFAARISAIEKTKAQERQAETQFKLLRSDDELTVVGDRPPREKGKSRESIAQKAGFSSEKQLRRAEAVAAKRPDLLEEVDAGRLTLTGAETQMKREAIPIAEQPPEPPKKPTRAELETRLTIAEIRVAKLEAELDKAYERIKELEGKTE